MSSSPLSSRWRVSGSSSNGHGAAVEADLVRLEVDLGLARLHQRAHVVLGQHAPAAGRSSCSC